MRNSIDGLAIKSKVRQKLRRTFLSCNPTSRHLLRQLCRLSTLLQPQLMSQETQARSGSLIHMQVCAASSKTPMPGHCSIGCFMPTLNLSARVADEAGPDEHGGPNRKPCALSITNWWSSLFLAGTVEAQGWTTKYVLRQSMKGVLPEKILSRPKMGFPVPIGSGFVANIARSSMNTC